MKKIIAFVLISLASNSFAGGSMGGLGGGGGAKVKAEVLFGSRLPLEESAIKFGNFQNLVSRVKNK